MYRYLPRRGVILYHPYAKQLKKSSQYVSFPFDDEIHDIVDKLKHAIVRSYFRGLKIKYGLTTGSASQRHRLECLKDSLL